MTNTMNGKPLLGYKAFYRGRQTEVYATSSLHAQTLAALHFKARKSYDVNVILCERADGSVVSHRPEDIAP